MNIRHLLLLLLFFPAIVNGQYRLKGRVTDILTHKPVENASVFLSNTSATARTTDDGSFDINNIRPGHYDLVVSIVGYVTYHQEVNVNDNISDLKLQIEAKNTELKEVKIGPDEDWDRNYRLFKIQFVGNTQNSAAVKILNPQVLSLHYDVDKHELVSSSYDFLDIENKALGYKVKYLLANLTANYSFGQTSLYYEGSPFFEDMPGKPSEIKQWHKKRQEAYLGSQMHFLRAVIANKVAEEGFVVRRLIRKPNADYPAKSHQKYTETLVATPLGRNDYVKRTDQPGQYALAFDNLLYVTYKGDKKTSTVTFTEPYAYFDTNGIIINPHSTITEGDWGKDRMGEMLPFDYEPMVK